MIKIENKKSAMFELLFPAVLKLFVISSTACIIGCVPKQTGFQTQNARLAIPSKCAHAGRKLTDGVMHKFKHRAILKQINTSAQLTLLHKYHPWGLLF